MGLSPTPSKGPHMETSGLLQEGKMTSHFPDGLTALPVLLMEKVEEFLGCPST